MFVSDIRTGTIYYWVGPNAILPVRTDGSDNFRQLCIYLSVNPIFQSMWFLL